MAGSDRSQVRDLDGAPPIERRAESVFVEVRGGRMVHASVLAPPGPSRRTVVFCHPAPGSARFDPYPAETVRRPVTLVAVDRPGYGGSDPVGGGRWASVGEAADDIAAVLAGLGCERVGVVGWSAGGRVALALAARRPELVDRVAVLATPAPNERVAWIPPDQAAATEALRDAAPEVAHAALASALASVAGTGVADGAGLALLGASDGDRAALEVPGASDRLGVMLADAFAQGVTGLAQDLAGFLLRPWGFDPRDVQARTLLLYGTRDPVVGAAHARWWQAALPNARTEMVPGAGHLLVVTAWRRVLAHLAPSAAPKEMTIA